MASHPDDDVTIGPSVAQASPGTTPGGGARTPGSSRFAPGSIIAGRYRLVALLGRGGMGEVYRAEDLTLDHPVALKFLPEGVAIDQAHLTQFHNELRVARQVSHKNVCRLYDLGEADGRRFLTMEYIDGEDLASLLRRIGRIPEDKAVDLARQLCAGLAAAHERGVLHRDLKPANVMIDGEGNVRITDFGLAVAAEQADAVRAGTPQYMAPEQLAGQPATIKSDIFALGLVLFEIFTGKRAYDAKTLGDLIKLHESGSVTTPSSMVRDLDPAVERIVLRCLERDPARRPASALTVAAALPGANPLADALTAGETPSPELLAAAGETEALGVARGLSLVSAILIGLVLFAALSAHTSIVGRVPLEKPPAVLIDRAEQIVALLGYVGRPADRAFGYLVANDYLNWLMRTVSSPRRWDAVSTGNPAAIVFWYRASPRPMSPLNPYAIRPNDPPLNDSGMNLVAVDTIGRLIEFHWVPPQLDVDAATAEPPRWRPLFDAADLPMDTFTPATPQWTPPHFADTRAAWEGPLPQRPDIRIRVEAAAYRGRPVSFYLVGPWSRPTRMQPAAQSTVDTVLNAIFVVALLALFMGAVTLARHHLRVNRADRRGAARLAQYVAAASVVMWPLVNHHVADVGAEFNGLVLAAAMYTLIAVILWVIYIALEPYVRRFWPDSLLGWSRFLAGHIRDPRVGRDTLMGIGFGVALSFVELGKALILPRLGYAALTPTYGTSVDVLFGNGVLVAKWLEWSLRALEEALMGVLLFVVLRLLLRRMWLVATVGLVILTVVATNQLGGADTSLVWLFPLASGALMTFVILRFGLLPSALMLFVSNVICRVPLTLDLSHWSATATVWSLGMLTGLTLFGFYAARGGQPLLGSLKPEV